MSEINIADEGSWGRFKAYEEEPDVCVEISKGDPTIYKEIEEFQGRAIQFDPRSLHLIEAIEDVGPVDDSYTNLPYLQASLFGTILEDTITQLRILVECNNELRIIKLKSDWNYLMRVKYSVKQDLVKDELEIVDPHNLACDEYKIQKLDYDRQYVTDVITATYVDLSLNKSFKALEDYVNNEVAKFEYRVSLPEEEANNNMVRKEVYKQMRVQRNHNKTLTYDADIKIDACNVIVEESIFDAECKSRYISNWQVARTEQHVQSINDKENVYSSEIEYYKQRNDNEQRVHTEVELLMNIQINELLKNIEIWMRKFDKDMETIEINIQIKKNDYKNMLDKRIALEETIAEHDNMMKAWIHFKEERERLRIYREGMNACATTVQSWWRGLLVRKQLGPYKRKAKGKPKH